MPYWSVYLDHLGFSALEIGQLMAIFLFTKVLAPNLWASLADRLVAKRGGSLVMLKFSTFFTLAFYSLLYLTSGFWPVAAAMLLYCFFWNASLPQVEAATLNHLPNKQQYGRVRLWGSIGFIITVTCVGLIMDIHGPSIILSAGALSLAALFLGSLLMQDKPRAPANDELRSVSLSTLINFKVGVLLTLCFLMQLSHAPLQTFMSLYLSDYGYSNFQIGLLWTTGVIFEIVIFIYAYKILNSFRLSSLLTFTFFITSLRWFMIGAVPEIPLAVFVAQALHALSFGLYHAVMMQIINRLFIGNYQIRGQALYSSVTFGLGGAIGSFISGYIWSGIGKQELFLLAGVLMLLVSLFSLKFTHKLTS